MSKSTFSSPDFDAFCMLSNYGVAITGQTIDHDQVALECRIVASDRFCHHRGGQAKVQDSLVRKVTHMLMGWRPTQLHLRLRRYRCDDGAAVWQQDTTSVVAAGEKLPYPAALWALKSVVIARLSIARVAGNLGVSWRTANDAVLQTRRRLLIDNPTRLNGVRVLGVDEHVWRPTTVMDPFYVVSLAGKALDQCRQRTQQATLNCRGRSGDPLYGARKTLLPG